MERKGPILMMAGMFLRHIGTNRDVQNMQRFGMLQIGNVVNFAVYKKQRLCSTPTPRKGA